MILVETLEQLQELKEYLKDKDFIAYDTETTGVDKESEIIGFSVAAELEVAYYVILNAWDVALQRLVPVVNKAAAAEVVATLVGKNLIMQNATFDCFMTSNYLKVDLIGSVHTDTLILGHLLNENRSNGLKERGVELYGQDARKEQKLMKESVERNGGVLTKDKYELYKADAKLIGEYGAKDAILTLKLFYNDAPQLLEEGLDGFFYDDESMPLLKGPTYELNTTGVKVDAERLQKLRGELEADCMEAMAYIQKEVTPYVGSKYPGTKPTNTFNISSGTQRSWLLFEVLNNPFHILTKSGRDLCRTLKMPVPYSDKAKRQFIDYLITNQGHVYEEAKMNYKTGKLGRSKKILEPWKYMASGKESLSRYADRYKWVARYLEYAKNHKLLTTYVEGIQKRMKYGIIRPSFLQHGTTSGRYSSKNPNFQNLPRDDKRVKACLVSRPGKVFVGADYAQLEPRVFASFSQDERLMRCFEDGDDFYSVIGMEVFEKYGCSLKKDDEKSFAKQHPGLRTIAKVVGLSATYGTTAFKMATAIGKNATEAQEVIDSYFSKFPNVHKLMLESHEQAKTAGRVTNLFGRPRRMPEALKIKDIYGDSEHGELPYEIRNTLNLAVNHRIQSTGASIMNRAAIAFHKYCKDAQSVDPAWADVKLILQVHDEIVAEAPEHLAEDVVVLMKHAMETSVQLPGVKLLAEPKIGKNLADLK